MKMSRLQQRFSAWMACLAILLVSLAPSVIHAVESANKATTWTEICTSSGVKLVQVTDDQGSDPFAGPKHDEHYEDCPFCRIDIHAFATPPESVVILPSAARVRPAPHFLYDAPRHRPAVLIGHPSRAPPHA